MRLPPPVNARLDDETAERVRRNHELRLTRMAELPAMSLRVIPGVELADGIATPIAHGLGRAARWVRESSPQGATTTGRVVEVRGSNFDRTQVVVLKATGWGATIVVDVLVL